MDSLTDREVELLKLIAEGFPNKWIANRMGLHQDTVKNHLYRIFRKIGVQSRTAAAVYAIREGIVS